MSLLIKLLIGFFILAIFYQLFGKNTCGCVEGLEQQQKFQEYDQNDALILARQNAGNIEVLRQQIGDLDGVKQQVGDLSGNVSLLEDKVVTLMEQQEQMATDLTGGTAPQVTGATDDETTEEVIIEEDTSAVEPYANYRRNYLL